MFYAFLVLCAVIIYTLWRTDGGMVYTKSVLDGNMYLVRNLPDRQAAADMLAAMRNRMLRLVDLAVSSRDNEDEFCQRTIDQLKSRFNPNVMSETPASSTATSYSVNKGAKVRFCLRSRPEGVLLDINTLMYVVLHESAHIASHDYGHTQAFWSNFKWLLRLAIRNNLYQYQDFAAAPVKYCGMNISSAAYVPGRDDDIDIIRKTPNVTRSCR